MGKSVKKNEGFKKAHHGKLGEKPSKKPSNVELGTEVRSVVDPFFKYYKYINFDIDPEKRPPTFGKKE